MSTAKYIRELMSRYPQFEKHNSHMWTKKYIQEQIKKYPHFKQHYLKIRTYKAIQEEIKRTPRLADYHLKQWSRRKKTLQRLHVLEDNAIIKSRTVCRQSNTPSKSGYIRRVINQIAEETGNIARHEFYLSFAVSINRRHDEEAIAKSKEKIKRYYESITRIMLQESFENTGDGMVKDFLKYKFNEGELGSRFEVRGLSYDALCAIDNGN